MKKILSLFLFSNLIIFFLIVIFLSTIGFETNRFNNYLEQKVSSNIPILKVKLKSIKIKIDLKKISFLIVAPKPDIKFYNSQINLQKINAYIDFKSLLTNKPNIKSVYIVSNDININQAKEFIKYAKPSNLKKFFLNSINKGNINFNLQFEIKDKKIQNYELDGFVKNFDVNFKNYYFRNGSFVYYIKENSGQIENIRGNLNSLVINSGFLNYDNFNSLNINGEINSEADLDKSQINRFLFKELSKKIEIKKLNGNVLNIFDVKFDPTLKIEDFNYKAKGEIKNLLINFNKPEKIIFVNENIDILNLEKTRFEINFSKKNDLNYNLSGLYKFNKNTPQKYSLVNNNKKNLKKINLNLDTDAKINIPILNFKKKDKIINIQTELELSNDQAKIMKFLLKENNNIIQVDHMVFKKNNFIKFDKLLVKTFSNDEIKNDFEVIFGKDIKINGSKYDATNLTKLLESNNKSNFLGNINKEIFLNLKEVKVDKTSSLFDLSLIGKIEKGKPIKIVSKGEFSKNKYLEISLKKDELSNKKLLEIYSDLPKALLSNYNFFRGLSGGKLLLNSTYDKKNSNSKLTIENFKVKNAPGFVKLLSLADFGGMADALSGEGLSFDKLEMTMEKNDKMLKLNELYAIGPSISILMDGYVEEKTGLVSLRGTMVPAKTLNKFLSKVPFLGDILIPKEIGEGLFGISFKMKGLPGKIKTSVNPIKTLTPRFIQKALGSR